MAGDGLPGGSAAGTAKLFGGHVGGRPRKDGFKPGSPEALAADREKNRLRMERNRAAERSASASVAPLPAAPAVPVPPGASPAHPGASLAATPLPGVGIAVDLAPPGWIPTDFDGAAPELVELAEAWRIDQRTKQAVAGNLPRRVVEEVAKDAAFPPGSKRSLSGPSGQQLLAEMFNALRVPVTLKKVVSIAPALAYIVVRDLQLGSRIEKLIASERERTAPPPPKPPAPAPAASPTAN